MKTTLFAICSKSDRRWLDTTTATPSAAKLRTRLKKFDPAGRIEPGSRFVKEQHCWTVTSALATPSRCFLSRERELTDVVLIDQVNRGEQLVCSSRGF